MHTSRPVWEIDGLSQSLLLNLCVSDEDLGKLGLWRASATPCGLSPALFCRCRLVQSGDLSAATAIGRRLMDLIDLRYFDAVVSVREAETPEVVQRVRDWVAAPAGESVAGLFWSLISDARPEVQRLGRRVGQEALVRACQSFVS